MPVKKLSKKMRSNRERKARSHKSIPIPLLMNEYEIVQNKIDNYGTSDISYKTLVASAAVASLYASDALGSVVLVLGIVIVFRILLSESENHLYEQKLIDRAQALEKAISKDGRIKRFPTEAYDVLGKNKIEAWRIVLTSFEKWRKFSLYHASLLILFIQLVRKIIEN